MAAEDNNETVKYLDFPTDETGRYYAAPLSAFLLGAKTDNARDTIGEMVCIVCHTDVAQEPQEWSECQGICCPNCIQQNGSKRCPQCRDNGNGCKVRTTRLGKKLVEQACWRCASCEEEGYGVKGYHEHFMSCAAALKEAYLTLLSNQDKLGRKMREVEGASATHQEQLDIAVGDLADVENRLKDAEDVLEEKIAEKEDLVRELDEAKETFKKDLQATTTALQETKWELALARKRGEDAEAALATLQEDAQCKDSLLLRKDSLLNDAVKHLNLKDAMLAGAAKKLADLNKKYEKQTLRINEKKDQIDALHSTLEQLKEKSKPALPMPLGTTAKAAPSAMAFAPATILPKAPPMLPVAFNQTFFSTSPPPIPALDSEGRVHKAPRLM